MNREVKSLMVLRGVKQIDICRKLEVTPGAISMVVSGKRGSPRLRQAIASALGKRVEDLWPPMESGQAREKRKAA